jgi:5-methyltetrahydropteroyltriglutamate--homocysteine methyltransferase
MYERIFLYSALFFLSLVHSPRVPSVEEMKQRFGDMLKYIPAHLLWANPDCGLKSRQWPETEAALVNMVEVAKYFRAQHKA